MAENVLDGISIIAPPIKRINLVGEIVEIAFIPARVDIEFQRVTDECKSGKMSDYDGLNILLDQVLKLCKSNPTITKDWLLDNVSFDMVTDFFAAAKGKTIKDQSETSSEKN